VRDHPAQVALSVGLTAFLSTTTTRTGVLAQQVVAIAAQTRPYSRASTALA